MNDTLIDLWNL